MRSAVAIVIVGLIGASACGGSTARSDSRVVTINALDDGTRAAHTARLSGEWTAREGGNTVVDRATGELNFDQDAMHIRAVAPDGKSVLEIIAIGKRAYGRGNDTQGLGPHWCALDATESIDPGAVLESLKKSHSTLQRVGDETTGGVPTTHYHVVGSNQRFEVWVDANDRLRRMIETSGDTTSTVNLADFGADIAPIEPPSTKDCPSSTEQTSPVVTVPQP